MIRKTLILLVLVFASVSAKRAPFQPKQRAAAPSKTTFAAETEALAARGGGDTFDKASLVKLHGYNCALFAVNFALESFGISAPGLGFKATLKGYELTDTVAAFLRILASFQIMVALTEVNMSDNPDVHKWFTLFHIPLAVTCFVMGKQTATDWVGWIVPSIPIAYTVAGLLLK